MPAGIAPPRDGGSAVWTTAGLSDWASIREMANTPMIANNAQVVAKSASATRDDTRSRVPFWRRAPARSVLRQQGIESGGDGYPFRCMDVVGWALIALLSIAWLLLVETASEA